jgi:two-component sensor histidine kinase
MHELATNSLKYGALSAEAGTLEVSSRSGADELTLLWVERGGPPVHAPPAAKGYGSALLQRSIERQLGGEIEHDWASEGLVVAVKLSRAKLGL